MNPTSERGGQPLATNPGSPGPFAPEIDAADAATSYPAAIRMNIAIPEHPSVLSAGPFSAFIPCSPLPTPSFFSSTFSTLQEFDHLGVASAGLDTEHIFTPRSLGGSATLETPRSSSFFHDLLTPRAAPALPSITELYPMTQPLRYHELLPYHQYQDVNGAAAPTARDGSEVWSLGQKPVADDISPLQRDELVLQASGVNRYQAAVQTGSDTRGCHSSRQHEQQRRHQNERQPVLRERNVIPRRPPPPTPALSSSVITQDDPTTHALELDHLDPNTQHQKGQLLGVPRIHGEAHPSTAIGHAHDSVTQHHPSIHQSPKKRSCKRPPPAPQGWQQQPFARRVKHQNPSHQAPQISIKPGPSPGSPDDLARLATETPQLKIHPKIYQGSTASKHCHICQRSCKVIDVVVCHNMSFGTCRKVTCQHCFSVNGWDWEATLAHPENWSCTHCRNTCPDRAQCFIYQRINSRRQFKKRLAAQAKAAGKHSPSRDPPPDLAEVAFMAPSKALAGPPNSRVESVAAAPLQGAAPTCANARQGQERDLEFF